jgi:hypothetical protein
VLRLNHLLIDADWLGDIPSSVDGEQRQAFATAGGVKP